MTLEQFSELKHQKEDWRRSVKAWVDRKSRQYKDIPLNIDRTEDRMRDCSERGIYTVKAFQAKTPKQVFIFNEEKLKQNSLNETELTEGVRNSSKCKRLSQWERIQQQV